MQIAVAQQPKTYIFCIKLMIILGKFAKTDNANQCESIPQEHNQYYSEK